MKLARKDLYVIFMIQKLHPPIEDASELWGSKVTNMRAFGILSYLSAPNCKQWYVPGSSNVSMGNAQESFVRKSMHNKMQLRRQFQEFKMVKRQNLIDHSPKLDELMLSMGAIRDVQLSFKISPPAVC
uniref:AlNc14C35G3113 protein n=1 Tax=Albugo laibachii Nc14 TaxID=890382 RepID=F0W8I7_9STRA|nr:AlNc14C35G3113 [Albugo laibachii Nc14]|eukprot:CCA17442.1 AlNc14C35G3113 [Albugo laibachii Nc14]